MMIDAQNGIPTIPDWLEAYDSISADMGNSCSKEEAVANINAFIKYLEGERDWIQNCED